MSAAAPRLLRAPRLDHHCPKLLVKADWQAEAGEPLRDILGHSRAQRRIIGFLDDGRRRLRRRRASYLQAGCATASSILMMPPFFWLARFPAAAIMLDGTGLPACRHAQRRPDH